MKAHYSQSTQRYTFGNFELELETTVTEASGYRAADLEQHKAVIFDRILDSKITVYPGEFASLVELIGFIGEQWEQAGLFTPSIPEEE